MVRRGVTRRGWRDGSTALETALVAPVFLTMVLGILMVGWGLFCGAEVRHAVERSSRMLIVNPDATAGDIETAVHDQLNAANADDVELTMTTETVGTTGEIARLSWTYGYAIDAPFIDPVTLNFDSSLVVPLRS
jgi:Flp pilus assembly protein TadG